ncbi:MAG: hypothetical protein FWD83_09525, partial [Promicromonosporaceae bacterium]|nr:hypothetical protein [Promicromonosporaceae bacterium]
MNWAYITLIVLAVFGVMLTVLWVRASRLDRLHRKVVGTRVALDKQLALRAAAAADLANSGLLDPASSIL